MILIFGGAYQGKLTYALGRFNMSDDDVYKCDDKKTDIPENKNVVYEIDKWILALAKANIDIEQSMSDFIKNNRDSVVICNDISCGIVPIDATLRKWREDVGRSLSTLSHESNEVIRLFCGIPTRLK